MEEWHIQPLQQTQNNVTNGASAHQQINRTRNPTGIKPVINHEKGRI
jgi:hypothetical protein